MSILIRSYTANILYHRITSARHRLSSSCSSSLVRQHFQRCSTSNFFYFKKCNHSSTTATDNSNRDTDYNIKHSHASSSSFSSKQQQQQQQQETLSVAIVGTGPSGCYTAKYLLSAISPLLASPSSTPHENTISGITDSNSSSNSISSSSQKFPYSCLQIDMIDKLPTPFGLVRSGVAPDHPEVKNVMQDFSKLFQSSSSSSSSSSRSSSLSSSPVEFWGNVHVGKDISLKDLQSLYHVVVLAYGCESDRRLGVEGEDLKGVFSAREFVAWYNGHPEFVSLGEKVEEVMKMNCSGGDGSSDGEKEMNVVVIGQGNVALDCARVLAKGKEGLMETDIVSDALRVIGDGVRRTTVLGRRGHVQGAFTIKELRELTKLDNVDFVVYKEELDRGATAASLEELKGEGSRPRVRMDKLLRDVAVQRTLTLVEETNIQQRKEVTIRFLLNPVKFLPRKDGDGKSLGSVLCERTRLEGGPGQQVAVGTGEMEEIPAHMALVSIGYKGVKLPGMDDSLFDFQRGIVRNTHGKVIDNLYVSGWLKRGPSGIIGTNIVDAKDTVSTIVNDLETISFSSKKEDVQGRSGLLSLLKERNVQCVDWASYQRIDAAERDPCRLRSKHQPREKITIVKEMLAAASS